MNQLCKVCGEPAAGFHFGAFTCEGCKSFFGRTYNNISSISECKNNGKCVINKKNRTACKACRLRKCMMVGMSKSGSRYGRRSNWFKIHCLLQQQQQQQPPNFMQPSPSLLQPNYIGPLFRPPANPPTNCESDSGASSADLDDGISYSDRISGDTDCFKNKFNNNNNLSPRPPAHPSSISPAAVSPGSLVLVPNQRWLPPPFPMIGDPAVWRELWLRGQPVTEPVVEQEQPIDLSVKQKEEKEGDCKSGPLDLTLADR